jgi:hypothetical protein
VSATVGDAARVTVMVAASPEVAFEVFTKEVDLWWRQGPRFRPMGRKPGVVHFEPGVGGRLFESFGDGPSQKVIPLGRVTIWEPPAHLAFEWRNSTFAPDEHTTVDVRFTGVHGKTEVTVEHRGWKALRDDHPAKHGLAGSRFIASVGTFWGDLMTAMREHVSSRG